ncbi:LuxR family transcriptional regulator [Burkholderia cepacia]|uniref:response regulator n=1 Tax=Burkholderia cepacia TaxID=292 RepID=UPI00075EA6FF|nr:response regulator [Burkholderia cepacia]KVQ47738.1 LuxR family transcriptional regulator [Burkholderia cepacia]
MIANSIVNVVIADDHPCVLTGITTVLQDLRSLNIVGEASNSTDIVGLLSKNECDVLITDFAMPDGKYNDGFGMLSYIKTHFPMVQIIVMTAIDSSILTNKITKIGVRAIVSKLDDIGHLISAIYAVRAGAEYFSPSVSISKGELRDGRKHLSLTKSEIEVLRLYVSGLSVSKIAERLHRTKQTISAQKLKAMRKLGIERDADLYQIVYESRYGLSEIFDL